MSKERMFSMKLTVFKVLYATSSGTVHCKFQIPHQLQKVCWIDKSAFVSDLRL